ncbi:hypothetical protein [Methylobacterium sp. 22177]|uniref:hypothetical protein n=1 Tax=Methylobacterium sp. 22177 TaxID=3453885 RepID=UPI003F83CA30
MSEAHNLLSKYSVNVEDFQTPQGCWTNWLGLHTNASWFPIHDKIVGRVIPDLPLPDDGVYGGAMEYISLLTGIDYKEDDREIFTAIELGAGWGPWISAVGVTCKRLGFKRINLVGVEAEATKVCNLHEHLQTNELVGGPVKSRIIRGAAWSTDTTLYFPKSMPMQDYGGAASTSKNDIDYRGFSYETDKVNAYSLETICSGLDIVDYAHWDVQGAEWPIAASSRELLNARFRYLFIGTHSRKIEGDLLNLFHVMGWDVISFEPCAFRYDNSKPTLEAMTYTDGAMFVRNPRLAVKR